MMSQCEFKFIKTLSSQRAFLQLETCVNRYKQIVGDNSVAHLREVSGGPAHPPYFGEKGRNQQGK